jgi:hypothetical protein
VITVVIFFFFRFENTDFSVLITFLLFVFGMISAFFGGMDRTVVEVRLEPVV